MKIYYMSDLHLEFSELEDEFPEGDVLILAGDIFSTKYFDRTLLPSLTHRYSNFIDQALDRFDQIMYVTGNHEYYNSSFPQTHAVLEHALPDRFNWLNNSSVTHKGVTFVGGTLWTGFPNNEGAELASKMMNDFRFIDYQAEFNMMGKFKPAYARKEHKKTIKAIEEILSYGPAVVVTHHCPSLECINYRFTHNGLDDAYATNLHWLIEKYRPPYWICGHTHVQKQVQIHDTKILMNCRGYPHERCHTFFDVNEYFEIGE